MISFSVMPVQYSFQVSFVCSIKRVSTPLTKTLRLQFGHQTI